VAGPVGRIRDRAGWNHTPFILDLDAQSDLICAPQAAIAQALVAADWADLAHWPSAEPPAERDRKRWPASS
jgi:hypothetical protein